jgi:hypothetical protein
VAGDLKRGWAAHDEGYLAQTPKRVLYEKSLPELRTAMEREFPNRAAVHNFEIRWKR